MRNHYFTNTTPTSIPVLYLYDSLITVQYGYEGFTWPDLWERFAEGIEIHSKEQSEAWILALCASITAWEPRWQLALVEKYSR